jgi:hypothetical protein
MRDFRNDMMGDKNRGPGQDEYRRRWRDIDNYRDDFGQPPTRRPDINDKDKNPKVPEMRRPPGPPKSPGAARQKRQFNQSPSPEKKP